MLQRIKNLKTKQKLNLLNIIISIGLLFIVFINTYFTMYEINNIIKQDLQVNVNVIEKSLDYINKEKKISSNDLNKLVSSFKIGETGYVYILSSEGVFKAHPTKQGKDYSSKPYIQDIINSGKMEGVNEYTSAASGQRKIVYYKYNKILDAYIVPGVNKTEYTDKILKNVLIEISIIIVLFFIIMTFLFRLMGKIIISALERFETGLVHFFDYAQGNTDEIKIVEIDRTDEFGEMAQLLNKNIEDIKDKMEKDKRDLTEIAMISGELENLQTRIYDTADKTNKLLETSMKINQLSETNQTQINAITKIIIKTNKSANKIQEDIESIEKISFQTNILSLNAAVEAATAGEEGKGFAVVATEVRNLANGTRDLSMEMKKLSKESLIDSETTKTTIEVIKKDIQEISELIKESSENIIDITSDTNDEKLSMMKITESLEKIK
jgi:methyl-accepting chemotaxis protein